MRIFIPSSGRSSFDSLNRGPALDFSDEWCQKMIYVVYPREYDEYYRAMSEVGLFKYGVGLVATPHGCEGIAAKRLWIGQTAKASGLATFGMFDDDIHFIVRKNPEETGLRPVTESDTDEMMYVVNETLKDYVHVGISFRQGNNNFGPGDQFHGEDNGRLARAVFFQTEAFLSVEHGRVKVMEDVDVSLQLLRKGLKNRILAYWSQDQKMTNEAGGCSQFRTHEVQDAAAREICRLHPGLAQLRLKVNKTGGAFGNRTEVTVYWKKAYVRGVMG